MPVGSKFNGNLWRPVIGVVVLMIASPGYAQTVAIGPTNPSQIGLGDASSTAALNQLITRIVLDNIPHSYNDTKHLGQTAQRFGGVQLRREGWKLETKRKWVTVNQGVWKKSSAQLLNPEKQFSAQLVNIRAGADGRTAFDLIFDAPLALQARQSHWENGVQLYSLSADAEAKVRLTVTCEMSIQLDLHQLPPEVVLEPHATAANLQVEHFAVKHLSKVGGEVAQQVTQWAKSHLDEQVAAKEIKILNKINQSIAAHTHDLRISLSDARASRWTETFWPHLGNELKEKIEPALSRPPASNVRAAN